MRLRPVFLLVMVVLAGCGSLPQLGTDPTPTATDSPPTTEPIPTTNDSDIGRQNGYAHNSTLSVDPADGLNESERNAVVSRAMARVELLRGKAFKRDVSVTVRSRSEFKQNRQTTDATESFRRFDNAKFEAMFLVGEETDSLESQSATRGQNILGYYSHGENAIILVSDSEGQSPSGSRPQADDSETPMLNNERTLAHELTHALQDQHFNLSSYQQRTRDEYSAVNGIIEGEANLVQQRYMSRCSEQWDCLSTGSEGSASPPSNWGVYLLDYFPYAEGVEFVSANQRQGGWERVDQLFSEPPKSAEQVIYPEKYGTDQPTSVDLTDRARNGWERVRLDPSDRGATRPDHAVLGQSGLSAMFAQTVYDTYNPEEVVPRGEVYNQQEQGVGSSPINYDLQPTKGWDGDRLHVYEKNGEMGYVWKLEWDSPQNASAFADAYGQLLSHWGATNTGGETWVIDEGPYADAFSVRVKGSTVVIVNAPAAEDLDDVRPWGNDG